MFCHDSEPGTVMMTSSLIERKNTESNCRQGLPTNAGLLICELKIYHSKKLCSWAVFNIQVLFAVTYSSLWFASGFEQHFFRDFFCIQCCMFCPSGHEIHFKIQMQFNVKVAFLIWLFFWFWIVQLILTWQTSLC